MVFAAISDAVFAQQCRVDLIPPWFGIGEHAVEIEDHSAEVATWCAHFYAGSAVKQRDASQDRRRESLRRS